jgi:hypothetical protein
VVPCPTATIIELLQFTSSPNTTSMHSVPFKLAQLGLMARHTTYHIPIGSSLFHHQVVEPTTNIAKISQKESPKARE